MRVAIAGGHGQIGLRLARLLSDRGDTALSLIRNPDHTDDVKNAGGEPILCDLESASDDEIAQAVAGADAIVFTAGAGPGSGPERKETVDYGGAVKLITAAKKNGISRYLIVSSVGADPNTKGDETYAVYQRAKGRADEKLMESGLDYTVVRPTRLTDEAGDGRVRIAERVGRSTIPRDDVAEVLAASLHEPTTIGTLFEVAAGDVPAEDALRRLSGGGSA
jgi:uncharacterized protein YbjT (DUF2867 family)